MSHLLLSTADGNTLRRQLREHQPQMIMLELSRREIEAGLVGSAVDRLLVLSDETALVKRYQDAVLLMVGGYDDDPRELAEIPAVRAFFRRLVREWPYLLHYVDTQCSDSLMVALRLLWDVDIIRGPEMGQVAAQLRDPAQARAVLRRLFAGLEGLYAEHRLPPVERHRRIAQINALMPPELT